MHLIIELPRMTRFWKYIYCILAVTGLRVLYNIRRSYIFYKYISSQDTGILLEFHNASNRHAFVDVFLDIQSLIFVFELRLD